MYDYGELDGKVVIVIGVGIVGNIGYEMVEIFVCEGVCVVLVDMVEDVVVELMCSLSQKGYEVVCYVVDILNEDVVKVLIVFMFDKFGWLDVFDNNVVCMNVVCDLMLVDMDVDWWDMIFVVNMCGMMLMSKYVIFVMIRGGGGLIVNISFGMVVGGSFFLIVYVSLKGVIEILMCYIVI